MENSPEHRAAKFCCPNCRVIAQQQWFEANIAGTIVNAIIEDYFYEYRRNIKSYPQEILEDFLDGLKKIFFMRMKKYVPDRFSLSICESCNKLTIWIDKKMIYPKIVAVPPPNEDMDEDIKSLYQEAATIFNDSPKGSTALLRLSLQKLLKQIGKNGKNINDDIKELVSAGLNPIVQQALDVLRVIGNNAVHPGQIDLDDNQDIAFKLFGILNFITVELISKPKELENLYRTIIPEEIQAQIKQRDGK